MLTEGTLVRPKPQEYARYGYGRVVLAKGDLAEIRFDPDVFALVRGEERRPYARVLRSENKRLSAGELDVLSEPQELAAKGQWDDVRKFDLRQWAAYLLCSNKGGQLGNARTEILPHQIFTAYEVVKSPHRRYLLADEVGLGKTIEAGMVWQALLQRGQSTRTLVVCPAGLTVQWQEEFQEKFGELFEIYRRDFDAINPHIWDVKQFAIASIETLKRADHKRKLLENWRWNLIIFDESHRLSAREDVAGTLRKTFNFQLAEDLQDHTDALLLLTATPHLGEADHSRFRHMMRLLRRDLDFSSLDPQMPLLRDEGPPFYERMLRTPKIMVTDAEGKKVFHGRDVILVRKPMHKEEASFYEAVENYIRQSYQALNDVAETKQRNALGFVLTVFQKLNASSSAAITSSLHRRLERLKQRKSDVAAQLKDEFEDERYIGETEVKKIAEITYQLLENEVELLEKLLKHKITQERKLDELLNIIEAVFRQSEKGSGEKILIFTEYLKTQDFLLEKLQERYGAASVAHIRGGMKLDAKRAEIKRFRDDEAVHFLISTETGGEGINLQFCHVMVNYDLPWNPMRLEQRIGRIYRYGQRKRCIIYNLEVEDTVEDTVRRYHEQRLNAAAKAIAKATGEDPEDIKISLIGQLENKLDYDQIYTRALLSGDIKQTKEDIKLGIEKARKAYELAVNNLFRDVSSYNFDKYKDQLQSRVGLAELQEYTRRYLELSKKRLRDDNGVLEFLVPEELRQYGLPERISRATFDRETAIREPNLEFLAIGHKVTNAFLLSVGTYSFGGLCARRTIKHRDYAGQQGWQFNFVLKTRIPREEGDEYLFDLHCVFVDDSGNPRNELADACLSSYSEEAEVNEVVLMSCEDALDVARKELERAADVWDWETDVDLLNVARVNFTA